jgi:uncharacterized protein (TIGR00369 family)
MAAIVLAYPRDVTPPARAAEPTFRDWEQRVRESFARQAFMTTLGASLASVTPGAVDIELPASPALTQQHGFVHAGALAAVLDSACGYAALSLMPEDAGVLTVEFKLNLLEPAAGERFIARGRVVRAGRTLTACEGAALVAGGDEGRPVATMTATMMALRGRAGVAG